MQGASTAHFPWKSLNGRRPDCPFAERLRPIGGRRHGRTVEVPDRVVAEELAGGAGEHRRPCLEADLVLLFR
jgi:hypothetical protein